VPYLSTSEVMIHEEAPKKGIGKFKTKTANQKNRFIVNCTQAVTQAV